VVIIDLLLHINYKSIAQKWMFFLLKQFTIDAEWRKIRSCLCQWFIICPVNQCKRM